jgi:hypothetical protein
VIDYGQDPKGPSVEQLIVHEIHAPPLPLCRRHGRLAAVQRHVLPSATAMPQLQSFEPIEPPDALRVHQPALAPQQDVEPLIAKARPRVG